MGSLFLFGFVFLYAASSAATNLTPSDVIRVSCGAKAIWEGSNGLKWIGDEAFLTSSQRSDSSTSDISIDHRSSNVDDVVPYGTARVSTSNFTYSFPVAPGRKFVRLYFNPSNETPFARFSVTSGAYTLLRDFTPTETVERDFEFEFEFSVHVAAVGVMNLTFAPCPFAFVNAIEIVSMPDVFDPTGRAIPAIILGTQTPFVVDSRFAVQTMYRLNVGGNTIIEDSGLFRKWIDDSPYLYGAGTGVTYSKDSNVSITYPGNVPPYIAPVGVYETARSMGPTAQLNLNYNLTWILPVDPGFYYLVRLHFCEIEFQFTKDNQRVFDIFIHNRTAYDKADVIAWSGGNGRPTFQDFVVFVLDGSTLQDLWVALHPDESSKPQYSDAILNGLEIFKLSNIADGNLAGPIPNPIPSPRPQNNVDDPSQIFPPKENKSCGIQAIVVGMAFLVLCMCLGFMICFQRQRKQVGKESGYSSEAPWMTLSLYGNSHSDVSAKTNANLSRAVSFAEIEAAMDNFENESLLMGAGGFGKC